MNHASTVRRTLLTGMTVAATALALTGCSLLSEITGGPAAERDAETNEVVTEGKESAFSLKVGDCYNDPSSSGQISDVPVVPCGDEHQNEVVAIMMMDDGEWPGADAVSETADQMCFEKFEEFIGAPYETSDIDFFSIMPSEGSWKELNDRELVCSVYDTTAETVTGSLKGVAR